MLFTFLFKFESYVLNQLHCKSIYYAIKRVSIAALDALLLSIITIVVSLIQVVFEPGTVFHITMLVKFVGCLALLYYFIKSSANLMILHIQGRVQFWV